MAKSHVIVQGPKTESGEAIILFGSQCLVTFM